MRSGLSSKATKMPAFITTRIVDSNGLTVPTAQNRIKYEIVSGPGQIVATDNGDATDLETFSHPERQAFNQNTRHV